MIVHDSTGASVSPASVWLLTLDDERKSRLQSSDSLPPSAEVVIVGAGIIGLAVAFYLSERGMTDIVVVERDTIAARASSANAGGLFPNQQAKGPGLWKTMADQGLEVIAGLAERDDFAFDFRRNGMLSLIFDPEERERAPRRVAEMQKQGFDFAFLKPPEVKDREPSLALTALGAILSPNDAHCNPVKLALEYADHARRRNAKIVTNTEVRALIFDGEKLTGLSTTSGNVSASNFVFAGGPWVSQLAHEFRVTVPIMPARGQMLATVPLPPLLNGSVVSRYMFTQLVTGHVISGGTVEFAGFEDSPTESVISDIRHELHRALPATEQARVFTQWSGLRPHTPDGLPIIGPIPGQRNAFLAAGHFKNGVLFSALTGQLVSNLICDGKSPPFANELGAGRFKNRS